MKAFLATTMIAVLFIGIFLASAFVLMLLTNVVLEYYGATPLVFHVALAINALLWLFGGAIPGNKD